MLIEIPTNIALVYRYCCILIAVAVTVGTLASTTGRICCDPGNNIPAASGLLRVPLTRPKYQPGKRKPTSADLAIGFRPRLRVGYSGNRSDLIEQFTPVS